MNQLIERLRANPSVQRALINERLRNYFCSFLRMTFETVVPGRPLALNWHHRAIAYELEQVRRGKTKRLIITICPRSLKSITASVAFPAFLLGHDPAAKVICVSYSDGLAVKHSNDFRAVLRSAWYQGLFPGTRISGEKNTETEVMTTKRGGRLSTSVGGTLTGRGGNIIILDDPLKPEEAMSDAARMNVLNWIDSTLMTRLNSKRDDAVILVMQRLHEDDPVAKFLQRGGWRHLNLSAIADSDEEIQIGPNTFHQRKKGDVLDPLREPLEVLDQIKRDMGTMAFSAQYLQNPIPVEGNMIQRVWLKYYDFLPERRLGDRIVISWDTAMSESELADYSVGTVWLVKKDYCYLIDVIRGRFDFPSLRRAVFSCRANWPDSVTLIEQKSSGISLLQDLRSNNFAAIGIRPDQCKVTRLYTVAPLFESGAVLFPKSAPWLDTLTSELLSFPNSKYKDQVDSISQALNWIQARRRSASDDIGMPVQVPIGGFNPIW